MGQAYTNKRLTQKDLMSLSGLCLWDLKEICYPICPDWEEWANTSSRNRLVDLELDIDHL